MDVPCSYPLVILPRVHRKQLAMPDMAAIRSPTANSGPSKKALRCRRMTNTILSVRQERRQPACLATGDLLLVIDDFLFSIARYCRWHGNDKSQIADNQ